MPETDNIILEVLTDDASELLPAKIRACCILGKGRVDRVIYRIRGRHGGLKGRVPYAARAQSRAHSPTEYEIT